MTDAAAGRSARPGSGLARLMTSLGDGATLGLTQRPRWSIFGIFVAVDVALIATHIVNVVTAKHPFLMINLELSLGEFFQYGKFLTIAFVMVVLMRRSRQPGPALWGLIFVYLAADDALAIHEAIGRGLARRWGLAEGATVSQVGAGLALGFVIAAVAVAAYTAAGLSHRVSAAFGIGLVGLGFFGVGVDALHGLQLVSENRWLNTAVRLVEEGG